MKAVSPVSTERRSRRRFDRTEALDTAMRLFWRHGYEATSMAMLLKAMGLTAPSLYVAFGNKEGLFREAVQHYGKAHGEQVIAPLTADLPARQAIEQMLLRAAATVSSSKNPAGCLLSFGAINSADHASEPATLLRELRASVGQRIRDRLERAVKDGELPATIDAARLARFYHATLGGIQLRSLDGATRAELEEIAHDAMESWPAPGKTSRRRVAK
jgi:TetR/AcrR family transcriptional regulator, copper-responsive repressor